MATQEQVRQYLAHWFQLGRRVLGKNDIEWCPQPVLRGDRYSPEFEACWAVLMAHSGEDYYLESTEQTLAQLLSASWELAACSRCPLLVPVKVNGVQTGTCPCSELASWPNFELPMPRLPVNSQTQLTHICDRVSQSPTRDGCTDGHCDRYPLPQSIALQTALELQIAKAQGAELPKTDDVPHREPAVENDANAPSPASPTDQNALGRIRDRLSNPVRRGE